MNAPLRNLISLLLITALVIPFACKKETQRVAKKMPPALNAYIYAYTSGIIAKNNSIRVRFVNPMVDPVLVGQEADSGLLGFSPNISGTTSWEDEQTLVFTPTKWLRSNTAYLATLNIQKIVSGLDPSILNFEFNFRTRDQYLSVEIDGLAAASPGNRSAQILKGALITSDISTMEEVKDLLKASQNGKALSITWLSNVAGEKHEFQIAAIERMENESEVLLSWNGKNIGTQEIGERKVPVPSIHDFVISSVETSDVGEQEIIAHFSDPLDRSQNFNGLVSITNYSGDFKFLVDGNQLKIYPSNSVKGVHTLNFSAGIKGTDNQKSSKRTNWNIIFSNQEPKVRLSGKGSIIPNSGGLVFPFEAVGLNAVDIEVFKIFDNNILQFLQTNDNLEGTYQMERVGRVIFQNKFDLFRLNPAAKSSEWSRYAVDLKSLIDKDPNAIYQVRVGFKQSYAENACAENKDAIDDTDLKRLTSDKNSEVIESFWDEDRYDYYEGFRWSHREDPCYPAYYNYQNFVRRNVLSSDIGMIAKRGNDQSLLFAITDLTTTDPLPEAHIDLYDYSQQLIQTILTDSDGIARVKPIREPFVAIATHHRQVGYLKMLDPSALSLSRFDVSGVQPQKGLKGYLYGERGVWRPGDSIYLNFVLEDLDGKLPMDHPIEFSLRDPRGQIQQKFVTSKNIKGVYPLYTATESEAPTGNWVAAVSIGGASFSKVLKIETVKPNRLKVVLDFGKEELGPTDSNLNGTLQVNWLHGAPGKGLKAIIESQIQAINTKFSSFPSYVFDDPARRFSAEPTVMFDGQVDQSGQATIKSNLNSEALAPGKLKINFKTRAFEKGGDFSTDNSSINYSPYSSYVGVEIPQDEYNQKRLDIDKETKLGMVLVDEKGEPLANRELNVGLYRIEWRWWWDSNDDDLAQFNSSNHLGAVSTKTLTTDANGRVAYPVTVDDWGRFLVRACDPESGHCTGDYFYAGYPWSENDDNARQAAAMLNFSAGKKSYKVGETMEIKVPASSVSRCLISVENGTKVLETYWKITKAGENVFRINTTKEMAPNVYVHVSLLQPHGQTTNDLSMRMYGVIPVLIENPKSKLEPAIVMPDVLKPKEKFTVQVSEKNKEGMTYTLAVVDDGLLDLTRFKTPNPWDVFFAREALGVNTWDMYDYVLGAYKGDLTRILSIGGDGEVVDPNAAKKANRFKPVVMHLGPFYLKPGTTATHEIMMPNYVGSVRTMVVASGNHAYGMTEKTTAVKKPLMLLATLPRVLGPTESLSLPVNIFAMENNIREVTVNVREVTGLGQFSGPTTQQVSFTEVGDQMAYFNLVVANRVGPAKFLVTATSGNESASQEIEINVRNPNPVVTNVYDGTAEAGGSWNQNFELVGMPGTNETILEVSGIPPINLGERLRYLMQYPHGCIEQTTSSGFPQLFVHKLLDLDEAAKIKTTKNIEATIRRLKRFQLGDGSFSYWPGSNQTSFWGTTYGGHFLLEAKNAGYAVPSGLMTNWKKAQRKFAREWRHQKRTNDYYYDNGLEQSYRLYTLALAGEAELGAMNRMQEIKDLPETAVWRLAAAYTLAGKPEIAEGLINGLSTNVKPYQQLGYTYGSDLRDQAMILETLVAMNKKDKAANLVRTISADLSKNEWFSTQTVAYSLLAVAKFVGNNETGKPFKFSYQVDGGAMVDAGSTAPIMQIRIPENNSGSQSVVVKNRDQNLLFVRVIQNGQPQIGTEKAMAENLKMDIVYTTIDGKKIDPARIEQGTDFMAQVTVVNPGTRGIRYQNMALTQVFPSGWEIQNTRMDEVNATATGKSATPDYQDIRDDRVYTYFDINRKESQTYRVQLNAAYPGKYYLPTVECVAMYDQSIQARSAGRWVEVVEATVE